MKISGKINCITIELDFPSRPAVRQSRRRRPLVTSQEEEEDTFYFRIGFKTQIFLILFLHFLFIDAALNHVIISQNREEILEYPSNSCLSENATNRFITGIISFLADEKRLEAYQNFLLFWLQKRLLWEELCSKVD